MPRRFTFKEIGYGYFGKNVNWLDVTDTKGRLSDKRILEIIIYDRMGSLDYQSPIYERLSRIKQNLEKSLK